MKSAESAVLIFLWSMLPYALAQEIPTGFKVERYRNLWERNPFYLVKPAGPEPQPLIFDKLIMTSWLSDRGKEVISVQNSETGEVQRITTEPNLNNLRLIQLNRDANPRMVRAIISDGKHDGTVKFQVDVSSPVTPKISSAVPGPNNSARASEPNLGQVAPQRVPHPVANAPETQTPGFPVRAPANGRPAYRIRSGVPVRPEGG